MFESCKDTQTQSQHKLNTRLVIVMRSLFCGVAFVVGLGVFCDVQTKKQRYVVA